MTAHTENQDRELAALVQLRDEDIDTSDIPEARDWSRSEVGKFYRPIKEPVTLRIDVDVLVWLKSEGPGYQTRINALLRSAMTGQTIAAALEKDETETSAFETAPSQFRFRSLERHGELQKCNLVAELITEQHSMFASAR
jgi:uncharacterized protein (DUF4415 family)